MHPAQRGRNVASCRPDREAEPPLRPRGDGPGALPMTTETTPRRLVSLDAFRGVVIAGMLVVNNVPWNPATPRQLMHAPWGQGVTFTDMILPWFVLAMGVALPQSPAVHALNGARGWRILRRAAVLIALGVLIDSLETRHVLVTIDVLQLLGLTYLVAAPLTGLPVGARLLTAAVLLAGHAAVLTLVPVPGSAPGVLQDGHNIVQYLNDTYFARYHVAGLLSVAPSAALALIGGVAGEVLRHGAGSNGRGDPRGMRPAAVLSVAFGGFALAAGGWAWGTTLPLSKALWTSSYALFAGGAGLVLLALCYTLADVAGWRAAAAPLAVLGVNAIVAYVLPILFKLLVLDAWRARTAAGASVTLESAIIAAFTARFGNAPTLWLYTGGYLLLWWLVLVPFYRARIFVRV
jgi:predicted acyltransferase